jgi:hypothetical protein
MPAGKCIGTRFAFSRDHNTSSEEMAMAVNYGNHEHRFAATAWFGTDGMKVSWGGVFAGVLVAMGVSMLLAALGIAIGFSAVDPRDADPTTVGIGAGIWGGLQLLIALFIGGMVATRVGAIIDRTTGFFEGMLVWVVSLILTAYLASSGIASVASGAFTLLGGATQTFGAVVQGQGGSANLDVSGTIEEMASELRSAELVNRVASVTGLSVNETRETLNETATRVEANREDPARAAEEARRGLGALFDRARSSGALAAQAEEIRPEAASTAWLTFVALLLSLAAACSGAMFGRSKAADAVVAAP